MLLNEPKLNDLYRDRKTGVLYRVLEIETKENGTVEVSCVHESPIPQWTWVGDRMDFLIDFALFVTNGISHKRTTQSDLI